MSALNELPTLVGKLTPPDMSVSDEAGEISNAQVVAYEMRHTLAWRDRWMLFDDGVWTDRLADAFVHAVVQRTLLAANPKKSGRAAASVERLMRPLLSIADDQWDAQPNLCGLPDGRVLNLDTATTTKSKPENLITMSLGAAPEKGDPETWFWFLRQALPSDGDNLLEAVRLWLRGALYGRKDPRDEFLFLSGASRTGKSTFAETILGVAGDYGWGLDAANLVGTANDHPQWKLSMRGKRFVMIAELPGRRLKATELNRITSGDTMSGRLMNRNDTQFKLQASVLAHSNHQLRTDNKGVMKRVVPIAMNRPPAEPDRTLKDEKLPAELGRILRWIVTAPKELPKWPAFVHEEREEFAFDNDAVEQWLESGFVTIDKNAEAPSLDALASFNTFLDGNNRRPWSQADLTHELGTKGYGKKRRRVSGKPTLHYVGFSLGAGRSFNGSVEPHAEEEAETEQPMPF